jgi:hypothetical protein
MIKVFSFHRKVIKKIYFCFKPLLQDVLEKIYFEGLTINKLPTGWRIKIKALDVELREGHFSRSHCKL